MRKFLNHPLALLMFIFLSALYSFSLYKTTQKSSVSQDKSTALAQEIDRIVSENERLEGQLEQANTPLAQEKIARNELLLQKPGERVIQISENPSVTQAQKQTFQEKTVWEQWQEVLF
jgi:cell division protein FtsB